MECQCSVYVGNGDDVVDAVEAVRHVLEVTVDGHERLHT